MAKRNDVLKQFNRLLSARLVNTPRTEEEIKKAGELWVEELDLCLPEYLEIAIGKIIRNTRYFPTISEVLTAHEEAMLEVVESRIGKGNANKIMDLSLEETN